MNQKHYIVSYKHFNFDGSYTTGSESIYALNMEEAKQKFIESHKNAPGKYEPTKVEQK